MNIALFRSLLVHNRCGIIADTRNKRPTSSRSRSLHNRCRFEDSSQGLRERESTRIWWGYAHITRFSCSGDLPFIADFELSTQLPYRPSGEIFTRLPTNYPLGSAKRRRFSLPIMGIMLGSRILGRCMEVSPLVKWIDDRYRINEGNAGLARPQKPEEPAKATRKRDRPGESTRILSSP